MSRSGIALIAKFLVVAGVVLVFTATAQAQRGGGGDIPTMPQSTPTSPRQSPPGISTDGTVDGSNDRTARLQHEQELARNSERQKKLIADTEKLLALATELKANVDKTNKDMLSVDVIRKADEIEKLAHSVKEKMKGG